MPAQHQPERSSARTINIVSECAKVGKVRGPRKVFDNLCKGLQAIGQDYVVNQALERFEWNWIHDSTRGLLAVSLLGRPAILGPNIAVLPRDLPRLRPALRGCIYLHPCEWALEVWRVLGFDECRLSTWPVGIDVQEFAVRRSLDASDKVLVYVKGRSPKVVDDSVATLAALGLTPIIIEYGHYDEAQYRDALSRCGLGVWIGQHESQGIALQEALASDLPLIVMDAASLFDAHSPNAYRFPDQLATIRTTAAPYFDSRCGLVIDDPAALASAVEQLRRSRDRLAPRAFIEEHLSLTASARKFVKLFEGLDPALSGRVLAQGSREFTPGISGRVLRRVNRWLDRLAPRS